MGRIFPPLSKRIFPSYWQPPIVETQYITDSVNLVSKSRWMHIETQEITDSIRKDLVKPNFVVETQTITDSGSYSHEKNLSCIADTWIQSPDENLPDGSDVKVFYGNWYARLYTCLFKFENPPQATIEWAKLYIFKNGRGGGAFNVDIQRCTSSWNEYTVTWATRPSITYYTSFTTVNNEGVWEVIDVTSLVQGWANNSYPNYGIHFYSSNIPAGYYAQWCSREGIYSPYIRIKYSKSI